mgnify:CR=1 FL=1
MFTVGQLWAVSAVLLARRGGRAMGDGGLFPTPCGPCAKPLGSLKLMHCPLFCLAAVQEMKQKRVKGKKVTQTLWPFPTSLGCGASSPQGRARMVNSGFQGAVGRWTHRQGSGSFKVKWGP